MEGYKHKTSLGETSSGQSVQMLTSQNANRVTSSKSDPRWVIRLYFNCKTMMTLVRHSSSGAGFFSQHQHRAVSELSSNKSSAYSNNGRLSLSRCPPPPPPPPPPEEATLRRLPSLAVSLCTPDSAHQQCLSINSCIKLIKCKVLLKCPLNNGFIDSTIMASMKNCHLGHFSNRSINTRKLAYFCMPPRIK